MSPRPVPVVAYSIKDASRASGIGETTLTTLIATGELRSTTVRRRRVIPADALLDLVNGRNAGTIADGAA